MLTSRIFRRIDNIILNNILKAGVFINKLEIRNYNARHPRYDN